MTKKLLFLIGLFFIIPFFPVKASLEFQTDYQIIYRIGPRGDAKVEQNITLTNKFSNIYPREYHLQLSGITVKNITAKDKLGNILNQVIEEKDSTKIKLVFNQEVAGKGNSLSFQVSYLAPRFALKKGRVWELSIPNLANLEKVNSLSLIIKVPTSFGDLSYASIRPWKQENQEELQVLSYQKGQLGKKPLVLAFGAFQILDFSLKFSLENPIEKKVKTEIPLPPDTPYQSVFLTKIDPRPEKIRLDQDLNWLAEYFLEPGETKTIVAEGQAKIFSQPENSALIEILRKQDRAIYLNQDRFWEVNHPLIKNLAHQYNTASKIYQWVVNVLDYDYQNLTTARRKGALLAYQTKIGVCTEFSDLFIALARAAGIPARELEGFALTNNQRLISLSSSNDVLHAWAEYWDESSQLWLPVDPTWAKTSAGMDFITDFDLGHFVFVTHGQSSIQPAPPGSYRARNGEKSVEVKFANQLLSPPKIKLEPKFNLQGKNLKLIVKNASLAPTYNIKLNLLGWKGKNQAEIEIDYLPPLGEKEFTVGRPSLLSLILGKQSYFLTINGIQFRLQYPKSKLNLRAFFAKLLKR